MASKRGIAPSIFFLSGLAERLVSPDKVQAAVAAYADYINRENRAQRAQAEIDARAAEKIDQATAGIMTAIEDGLYQPAMKARDGTEAAEG